MKIVTLSSKDIFGGAAKVAYRLHRSLLNKGINNKFVVNNKRSKDDSVIRASSLGQNRGFIYNSLNSLRLKNREIARIKKWDRYLSTRLDKVYMDLEISLLGDTLDRLDFDLLHLHWVGESFVNFTEFRNVKEPVVWTLHDCFPFTGICTYFEECDRYKVHCCSCPQLVSQKEKDLSFEVFEQKIDRYKNIDFHIVCPSRWLAESAQKSRLLGNFPIDVIPNGIDTDFFCPLSKASAKESLGINQNQKIVLFGGVGVDKDTRKGGHLLMESLEKLKNIYSDWQNIRLLILGTDDLGADFGFDTTYLGYVDNEILMRIAYSAADVTIVPSMYENLPTVIMESLSCGTPVTAFNIGGNSDMVDHQGNGYLAVPYDTSDLAHGIKYCLENNEEETLSENARKKVLDNFKIEDVTQRYIDLYKRILNK